MAKRCAASGALSRASRAFCDELAQGASAKTVWGSLRAEQVPSRAARWMRPRSDPEYRKRRSEIQLPPGARAPLFASGDEALLTAFAPYMRALARLSDVRHCADESALN